MKKFLEGLLIWLVIIVLISVAYIQFSGNVGKSKTTIPFSEFLTKLEENDVENIVIKNQSIEGKFRDGSNFNSSGVIYSDLIKNLHDRKVRFSFSTGDSAMSVIGGLLISWVPTFIFIGFLLFFLKQTHAGGYRIISFGKSRTSGKKVTFDDVAGIDEVKEELVEIVDFLKQRQTFQILGGKIPRHPFNWLSWNW